MRRVHTCTHISLYRSWRAAKGIPVTLITEAGEAYAEATPAVDSDDLDTRPSFDLELTAVASSSARFGADKPSGVNYTFVGESLQSGLLRDSEYDAASPHTDHSVAAAKILPALLRCGLKERSCAMLVFVLSAVIAVATLAMQALNPTSVAAS